MGHLPFLQKLVSHLVGGDGGNDGLFTNSGCVTLKREPSKWVMVDVLTVAELSDGGVREGK